MRLLFLTALTTLTAADDEDARLNEHWKVTFPTIDSNGDQTLSLDEVTQYLKRGHHVMSREEKKDAILGIKESLAAEFLELDLNRDGFLDQSEQDAASDSPAQKKGLRRGDANADDKLTLDEYIVSKNPHYIMDAYDRNQNGALDFDEYDAWKAEDRAKLHIYSKKVNEDTGMMTISMGTPDDMREKAKIEHDADFTFADENKDNMLQEAEFEEYLRNKGGLVWRAEGEEFFMYVDTNKDGKITLAEMQDAKYVNPMKLLEKVSMHDEM